MKYMEARREFGRFLWKLMQETGTTERNIADVTGLKETTIAGYRSGNAFPGKGTFEKIVMSMIGKTSDENIDTLISKDKMVRQIAKDNDGRRLVNQIKDFKTIARNDPIWIFR